MSDQTEFVLRQELRTLQIMNDSKSREMAAQSDYVKRLQQRNKALEAVVEAYREYMRGRPNLSGESNLVWDMRMKSKIDEAEKALAQLDKGNK